MKFTERHYVCPRCHEAVVTWAWNTDAPPACPTCRLLTSETEGWSVRTPAVHDDQLEGGPRRFEHMGADAPFIESKSHWRREVERRGLVNVVRHDSRYYARQRKQHDEELRDTAKDRS
jgi:hypothetical protein